MIFYTRIVNYTLSDSYSEQFMSDNICKDGISIIKRVRYVYVCDFECTVCLSEYLSIFFMYNEITCFIFAVLTP